MSTSASPVVHPAPPTTAGSPPSTLAKDWTWFTSHLTAIVIVIGLIVASVYFVESLEAKHDAKEAAIYTSLSAAQTAQNQALETQLKTDESNWTVIQSQLLAQNSQLAQAVAQKNQQLSVQVKTDATLDAQSAATKLEQQTGASSGEVVAQNNNVVLDLPVTRRVVSDLDTLPVVQSNLASTQTQLTNETTVANNNAQDAADQKKVVAGLQTQITDDSKACDAKVAAANAKVKKAGIKGFFEGAIAAALVMLGHAA